MTRTLGPGGSSGVCAVRGRLPLEAFQVASQFQLGDWEVGGRGRKSWAGAWPSPRPLARGSRPGLRLPFASRLRPGQAGGRWGMGWASQWTAACGDSEGCDKPQEMQARPCMTTRRCHPCRGRGFPPAPWKHPAAQACSTGPLATSLGRVGSELSLGSADPMAPHPRQASLPSSGLGPPGSTRDPNSSGPGTGQFCFVRQ